jgi:hypothetical protein
MGGAHFLQAYVMALHEQSVGASSDWRTPAYVFEALGCEFDVDVASPGAEFTPWIPAKSFITHDSLRVAWRDFAWMNPPFGGRGELEPWLKKFFEHGDGIALVPDRTSAPWWQRYAPRADLILFVAPKIKFLDENGTPGKSPAQGTCLLAISARGCAALERAAERGLGVLMRPEPLRRPARPSIAQKFLEMAPTAPVQRDLFDATA